MHESRAVGALTPTAYSKSSHRRPARELSDVAIGGIRERDALGQSRLDCVAASSRGRSATSGGIRCRVGSSFGRSGRGRSSTTRAGRAACRPAHARSACRASGSRRSGSWRPCRPTPCTAGCRQGTRVPMLHEPRVVDHPGADALARLHRVNARGRAANSRTGPSSHSDWPDEVQQMIVRPAARARGRLPLPPPAARRSFARAHRGSPSRTARTRRDGVSLQAASRFPRSTPPDDQPPRHPARRSCTSSLMPWLGWKTFLQ